MSLCIWRWLGGIHVLVQYLSLLISMMLPDLYSCINLVYSTAMHFLNFILGMFTFLKPFKNTRIFGISRYEHYDTLTLMYEYMYCTVRESYEYCTFTIIFTRTSLHFTILYRLYTRCTYKVLYNTERIVHVQYVVCTPLLVR